jgi:ethanolamine ammonia-lyase small subunit
MATRDLLDFQRCHALARDAVHARLDAASLVRTLGSIAGGSMYRLHSAAADRATYLQRPDLGRRLDDASRELLTRRVQSNAAELALIVADGLSALAVERHAAPLVEALLPLLDEWKLAPLCVVEQGRVAIGDEIGEALGVQAALMLIGERPGLSSPDSLGAYITWQPRPGRTDAERNCISNIRSEGLSYAQAAAQIVAILSAARQQQITGVTLKLGMRLIENSNVEG